MKAAIASLEPSTVEHALDYAARGWFVFPAPGDGSKMGCTSAEKSNGNRWGCTTDTDEIVDYFTKQFRKAGIGIALGESDLFVVEADTPEGHDVDGIASLRALEAKHGKLPETRRAISPTGSLHYYFKQPPDVEIRDCIGEIATGIDIKGDGGMVIAPPSFRPGKGWYRWLNANQVADAPDWLIALYVAAKGDDNTAHVPNDEPQADPALLAAAMAVIPNDAVLADARDKPPGVSQREYNKIGMACFSAFGGSEEGFKAFDQWARKSKKYHGGTRKRWKNYFKHPPSQIGAGSIIHWANKASPGWRRQFEDAQADAHMRASRKAAVARLLELAKKKQVTAPREEEHVNK